MKKSLLISFILFCLHPLLSAQQHATYVVYLKDKSDQPFNPYTYFDTKAIQRRINNQLPLVDYRDLPVNQEYIEQVEQHNINMLVASRWLNALFIEAAPEQLLAISKLHFVKSIDTYSNPTSYIAALEAYPFDKKNDSLILLYQTDRFQAAAFRAQRLTGKGIRIAVFDVGFNGADKHKGLSHIYEHDRLIGTYDFIKKDKNVYHGGSHGTNTLSCIAGKWDSIPMGMATDAEFLLARTEWNVREKKQEEYFWLAAAEWADKNGASIISSSLGYGKELYKVKDMDGHHSVVSFAATVAAQKGILVVNSAGNEYDSRWKTIITPADADSVLCVGGINPFTDRQIYFSSRGPSSDFRLKPNVSAPGQVLAASPNGSFNQTWGTSFSCPLVSGFAACAWQSDTSLTNMQLFKRIEQSGSLFPYYDYMHGYGVPQAPAFTGLIKQPLKPTFSIKQEGVKKRFFTVHFTDSIILERIQKAAENYEVPQDDDEKKRKKYTTPGLNLYWKLQSADGRIKHYRVIAVYEMRDIEISPKDIAEGDDFVIHFEGYTQTINLR